MTNPVSYLTMKIADILDAFAGGIEIATPTVLGTGMNYTGLNVADIMRSAAMVGGFTQSLVSMIASSITNNGGGFTGSGLLNLVGINTSGVSRGNSTSTSGSGTVLNANYEDMSDSATGSGTDEVNKTVNSAQEETTEVSNSTINDNIVNIYNLLQNVVDGTSALTIRMNGISGEST